MPMWWNWQTRTTQNRVGASPCGFNSHHRHRKTCSFKTEVAPVKTFQEALISVRNTVCVQQRGNTCLAYGGIQCDTACPAFSNGIKRRKDAHEKFIQTRIREEKLPNGTTLRISTENLRVDSPLKIEIGEYADDGQGVPVFSYFQSYTLPRHIAQVLKDIEF